jgi:hypothetical protein
MLPIICYGKTMKKFMEHPMSMSLATIIIALLSILHPGFQMNPAAQSIIACVALLVGGLNHIHSVKSALQIQHVLAALAASKPADAQSDK